MSAKTKIIVLHMKELVLAAVLTAVGLILLLLMALLFFPKKTSSDEDVSQTGSVDQASEVSMDSPLTASASYTPGIYKATLMLGSKTVEVETILSSDRITSIRLVNLDDAVTTMYPLLEPAMERICDQVYEKQSLDGITYDSGVRYTSLVLLQAIRSCLDKAAP